MSLIDRLPFELRRQVWEDCMVVNLLLIPSPNEDEKKILEYKHYFEGGYLPNLRTKLPEKGLVSAGDAKYQIPLPCMALLAVSKSIRAETAQVLVGRNMWRITVGDTYLDAIRLWRFDKFLLRRVSLGFSMFDVGKKIRLRLRQNSYLRHYFSNQHDALCSLQRKDWRHKWELLDNLRLDELMLDVDELACPDGCCRASLLWDVVDRVKRKVDSQNIKTPTAPSDIKHEEIAQIQVENISDKLALRAKLTCGLMFTIVGFESEAEREGTIRHIQAFGKTGKGKWTKSKSLRRESLAGIRFRHDRHGGFEWFDEAKSDCLEDQECRDTSSSGESDASTI